MHSLTHLFGYAGRNKQVRSESDVAAEEAAAARAKEGAKAAAAQQGVLVSKS